jgi:glycosyltransferase involved in cell wall biosynthesis
MKIVWIFQTGEPINFDKTTLRPMRAINLSNALLDRGFKVVIWTSNFSHQFKTKRFSGFKRKKYKGNLIINYIDSPGYKINISIRRLWDHFILSINLLLRLVREREIPDVAFVGFPPIEFAFVASFYLKIRKIPYVLDVKDQWPDLFVNAFSSYLRPFFKIIFSPLFLMSKYSMRNCHAICSMSEGFLTWIFRFANLNKNLPKIVTPLSSNIFTGDYKIKNSHSKWWRDKGVFHDDKIRIIFIGSLSSVFDFDTLINTAILSKKFGKKIQFVICGGGYQFEAIKKKIMENNLDIILAGWVDVDKVKCLASISNGAIAPYKNSIDFTLSIPNKILDYMSLGLPIFSPLDGEVKRLIREQSIGFFYPQGNHQSLFEEIVRIKSNSKIQSKIQSNNIRLFKLKFDSTEAYNHLVDLIIGFAKKEA